MSERKEKKKKKLDLASPWKIMPLPDATGLIVPSGLTPEALAPYRETGVEIVEA